MTWSHYFVTIICFLPAVQQSFVCCSAHFSTNFSCCYLSFYIAASHSKNTATMSPRSMENSKASFSIVGYSWKAAKGESKCWCPCRVSNSQSKLSGWTQLAYAEKKANPYIWQSQGAAASFEIDTCTKTELGQDLLTLLSSPAQRTADPLDCHKMAHSEYKMAFRKQLLTSIMKEMLIKKRLLNKRRNLLLKYTHEMSRTVIVSCKGVFIWPSCCARHTKKYLIL